MVGQTNINFYTVSELNNQNTNVETKTIIELLRFLNRTQIL